MISLGFEQEGSARTTTNFAQAPKILIVSSPQ
jgi:hypothetical protein